MAIIALWGWHHDPDEDAATRSNSAALDDIEAKFRELFPNEQVSSALGGADRIKSDTLIHIIVDCSFDVHHIRPSERKKEAERALVEVYERHFPDWSGNVIATLR
ncbi:MAG: hypothetical protein U9Q03_02675 [Patescibacteria group bacterium]|nr:hypothetical protein [Patescibacteria group bacterium]